jgi:hypothetical protein
VSTEVVYGGNRHQCDWLAGARRVGAISGHLAILTGRFFEMRSQIRRRAKWPRVALCQVSYFPSFLAYRHRAGRGAGPVVAAAACRKAARVGLGQDISAGAGLTIEAIIA